MLQLITYSYVKFTYNVQGSYAGNASGFSLSTLSGVWETQSNTPGMTLLHYIESTAKQQKLNFFNFVDELTGIHETARFDQHTIIFNFINIF